LRDIWAIRFTKFQANLTLLLHLVSYRGTFWAIFNWACSTVEDYEIFGEDDEDEVGAGNEACAGSVHKESGACAEIPNCHL
jgi:hypothetical protein